MEITEATIRRAITDLGVTEEIYAVRVVGNRLQLHLVGGPILLWPPGPPPEDDPELLALAEDLLARIPDKGATVGRADLLPLAHELAIPHADHMTNTQLARALLNALKQAAHAHP